MRLLWKFFTLVIIVAVLGAVAWKTGLITRLPQQDYKAVMSRKVVETIGKDARKEIDAAVEVHRQNSNDMDLVRANITQGARVNFVEEAVKEPQSALCRFSTDVRLDSYGRTVKEFRIPAVCEAGTLVMVWLDGPRKTIRAELLSGDGDMLTIQPTFTARRNYTAQSLGGGRWLFDGDVLYRHDVTGKTRILRITIE